MGIDHIDLLQLREEAYKTWNTELLTEWNKLTQAQMETWGRQHSKANQKKAAVSSSLEIAILERDHYTCRYCGKTMASKKEWQIDHVHPFSKGGETSMDNLVTACRECNKAKLYIHGVTPLPLEFIQQILSNKAEAQQTSKLRQSQLHAQWREQLETQDQHNISKHYFFYRFQSVLQRLKNEPASSQRTTSQQCGVSAIDQVYDVDAWIQHFLVHKGIKLGA